MAALVVLIAAIFAWATKPSTLEEVKAGSTEVLRVMFADRRVHFIAWAVVCVAMVAGLVAWTVLQ